MNYYPFHIGDYASKTRHLSWDEDLAYRRLIDAYYTREEPIPIDRRQAYRLVCAATPDQREAVDTVLAEFFYEAADGWRNTRCDDEIGAAQEKREKAAQSAKTRWRNAKNLDGALPVHSERTTPECECTPEECVGNAPNPKTNPNTSTTSVVDKKARVQRFDAVAYLGGKGVSEKTSDDWMTLRKAKKAAVTETAIDGVEREAEKAGMSLDAALIVCCQRGWAGFKADWVTPATNAPPTGRAPNLTEIRANTIAELTGRNRSQPNERTERDITAESLRLI